MHFFLFSFYGCKETTTAKENSTVLSPIGLYDDASRWIGWFGWSIRAYGIRITQKEKKKFTAYMLKDASIYNKQFSFLILVSLILLFCYFSLICDAFAQSELTPLNPE